ncbi:hypothetical protein [Agromyces humi]|uniref:hypothetical protein n=1 Tax=Agromyces humi TaxID=1766800 RepID=UPI00135BE282|nr:hypothetical protein [Agromyces humi]
MAAASALALAAGAIGIVGGQAGTPTGAPDAHGAGTPAAPIATAKPEVVVVHGGIPAAPDTTATPEVVAVWARADEGWILVYDDGRVLSHPEVGPVFERRLSPRGLNLVRSGTVEPRDLQLYLSISVPTEAWADPIPETFRPDRYAVCKLDADASPEDAGALGDVGSIWRRLPSQMQALLRAGRVLSFAVDPVEGRSVFLGQEGHHLVRGPGRACFVLSPGQARAAWALTEPLGSSGEEVGELRSTETSIAEPIGVADSDFLFLAVPLLPHGGWIVWGH